MPKLIEENSQGILEIRLNRFPPKPSTLHPKIPLPGRNDHLRQKDVVTQSLASDLIRPSYNHAIQLVQAEGQFRIGYRTGDPLHRLSPINLKLRCEKINIPLEEGRNDLALCNRPRGRCIRSQSDRGRTENEKKENLTVDESAQH